ncbi:MAG: hypothetical protein WA885_14090 [Phormidesmis sp.]
MKFYAKQLPTDRWGIYCGSRLLATVACQLTCETILSNLSNGRRDVSRGEYNTLYNLPDEHDERAQKRAVTVLTAPQTSERLIELQLAEALSSQTLKVKDLEAAVIRAQKHRASLVGVST